MQLMTHISWPVLVAASLGTTAAVLANMISFVMIGKINALLPERDRLSYLWWGTEVRKRFKQLYPAKRLVLLLDSCLVLMVLSFIVVIRYWVFS